MMYDILLQNCHIFGHDESDTLGIRNGLIEYIGNGVEKQAKKKIDLEGRMIVPGFVDSHTHMLSLGLSLTGLELSGAKSKDEALNKVKEYAKKAEKIIVGRGWDESLWKDRTYITREDLDVIEKPVILFRRDGHMATLNTAALRILALESRKDGILKEKELDLLDPLITPSKTVQKKALQEAFKRALQEGVTFVRDIVDANTFEVYKKMKHIPIGVKMLIYDNDANKSICNESSICGVKTFLDGSIGAMTAAVSDWDSSNVLATKDNLSSIAQHAWSMKLPLAVHAIGDKATELAAEVLSEGSHFKNSIEHFELVHDDLLQSMDRHIIASCQPNFLQWSLPGGLYERRLGRYWLENNNPYRKILDSGIHLAFGSDCMPFGPLYGIKLATSSPFQKQRISAEEAITCYTYEGAYLLGMEQIGKLEKGYYADIVILSNTLDRLDNCKVEATLVHGRTLYSSDSFKGLK
ncbi:MAG: amidohydrolase [Conexivisphaerales archaeon]